MADHDTNTHNVVVVSRKNNNNANDDLIEDTAVAAIPMTKVIGVMLIFVLMFSIFYVLMEYYPIDCLVLLRLLIDTTIVYFTGWIMFGFERRRGNRVAAMTTNNRLYFYIFILVMHVISYCFHLYVFMVADDIFKCLSILICIIGCANEFYAVVKEKEFKRIATIYNDEITELKL
jgi:hypothetical protein